jgi:hypothetical protein
MAQLIAAAHSASVRRVLGLIHRGTVRSLRS